MLRAMKSANLLDSSLQRATPLVAATRRHKADGVATAAVLIQIAGEMLETSPTLRKRMNITLSDLAAADKVRKELVKRTLSVQ